MNEKKLDKKIKTFYQQKKMSTEALSHLKQMIHDQNDASQIHFNPVKTRFNKIMSYVSFSRPQVWAPVLSCLILVVALTWQLKSQQALTTRQLQTTVVKEVLMNHKKGLSPDFAHVSFDSLGALMPKLEFSPVLPDMMKNYKMEFLGSRYCSILGNLAIQLKFKTTSGKICTLYQTPMTKLLSHIKTTQVELEEPPVLLWQEKGLFMAFVGEIN